MKTIFLYDADDFSATEIEYIRKIVPPHLLMEASENIIDESMVDIFDFEKYHKEYKFMGQYFKDLERVLRTALLIDYKYNHQTEEGRTATDRRIEKEKSAKDKRAYLENLLDAFEPLYILHHFYRHYDPTKNASDINAIYKKYELTPGIMFNCAYRVHVDKEWPKASKSEKLWFE